MSAVRLLSSYTCLPPAPAAPPGVACGWLLAVLPRRRGPARTVGGLRIGVNGELGMLLGWLRERSRGIAEDGQKLLRKGLRSGSGSFLQPENGFSCSLKVRALVNPVPGSCYLRGSGPRPECRGATWKPGLKFERRRTLTPRTAVLPPQVAKVKARPKVRAPRRSAPLRSASRSEVISKAPARLEVEVPRGTCG